jgi:hypothetical protein
MPKFTLRSESVTPYKRWPTLDEPLAATLPVPR